MLSIAERLKKLEGIDDSGLMIGYRFLVKSRGARRRSRTVKAGPKKVIAKKDKASASSPGPVGKLAYKKG
jgi:hypothetical protein